MAVAVKNTPETTSRTPLDRLPVVSLAGAAFILASLAGVLYGIPHVWDLYLRPSIVAALGGFFDSALLLVVMLAAMVGLAIVGRRLLGPAPPTGWKAGVFTAVAGLFLVGWVAQIVGLILPTFWTDVPQAIGLGIVLGVFVAGIIWGVRSFFKPTFQKKLVQFAEQGWFSAAPYKRNQGMRVRRGTILGLLILAGCGIYTLLAHKTLDTAALPDWRVVIPFADIQPIPILPAIRFTVPMLLAAGSLWIAYRLVNYPTFADFLIATEAELNKVSWTSRKKLIQDTIVVLTTVVLVTFFIFVVDIIWGFSLNKVGVLYTPEKTNQERLKEVDW
jgi:preprotein translocase SecE subunit